MKKEITKIWGVGLAIVLAASLLFSALPVSASTLAWGDEDLPEEFVDNAGEDILDMVVAGDGETIYACVGSTTIYRSTDVGEGWSSITVTNTTDTIDVVNLAVSPDDENYVAAVADNSHVYISDDAGANWDSLGMASASMDDVRDIAISVEKSGNRFVAVAGVDTGTAGEVWYYEIGAIGADWEELSAEATFAGADVAGAVAFSPNFASDEVLVAVTANFSDFIQLQIFSFNKDVWNSGTFADYPVDIVDHDASDAIITALDSASIAMAPDYLGSDDAMRVVFVGLTAVEANEDEACGIFRLDDDDVTTLKDEANIHSVDFDGTNLVAGEFDTNTVRRSADPLGSSPTVSGSTGTKEPGGTSLVVAAFAGADVVAGTSGDESAFAVSKDDGKTFNDISLIDTALTNLLDVVATPDGSAVYLLSNDGTTGATQNDLSLWRLASSWERVLSLPLNDGSTMLPYIIRMAPDDEEILYVSEQGAGGSTIYYTTDGGDDKWHTRVSRYDVADLAVEGDGSVAYVLVQGTSIAAHVSKSTNSGFTWATQKSHKISAGANMIASLGEDELLVAGDGMVSYSTDGNDSWTKLDDGMSGTIIHATATGLDDGDFVFAINDETEDAIYRWEIGEDDEWDDVGDVVGEGGSGITLLEGVLYAMTVNSTAGTSTMYRTLNPTDDDPTWSTALSDNETLDATPSALKLSRDEDVTKLWAIDTSGFPNELLFSFDDTLATVGPTVSSPPTGMGLKVNPITGKAFDVTFTWTSPSDKVEEYDLVVALDSGFDETVLDGEVADDSDEGETVSQVVGPGVGDQDFSIEFMPDTTYYWRVRVDVDSPIRSPWSETRNFTTEVAEVTPPVIVETPVPPVITPEIVIPTPEIVLPAPEIILPAPTPAPEIVIPPAPAPTTAVPAWALWAIIAIGAILVIALIVLIMRTRRPM